MASPIENATLKLGEVEGLITELEMAIENLDNKAASLYQRLSNVLPQTTKSVETQPTSSQPRETMLGSHLDILVTRVNKLASTINDITSNLEN